IFSIAIMCALFLNCSGRHVEREPEPRADVRIDLRPLGLPGDFFLRSEELPRTIIGYRFVVWLDRDDIVVGFNTSPSSRVAADRKVDGSARLLVFSVTGVLKSKRDLTYPADGYGEIVAEGEASAGPSGTLCSDCSR